MRPKNPTNGRAAGPSAKDWAGLSVVLGVASLPAMTALGIAGGIAVGCAAVLAGLIALVTARASARRTRTVVLALAGLVMGLLTVVVAFRVLTR